MRGSDLDGQGRTGHIVYGDECCAAEGDVEAFVQQRPVQCARKCKAAIHERGLSGLPGEKTCGLAGRKGRSEKVNPRATLRGVQTETSFGFGVVGDLSARGRVDSHVGFARGDHVMPRAPSRERKRTLNASVEFFSIWPLASLPPVSSPPCAASRTTANLPGGTGRRLCARDRRKCDRHEKCDPR